MFSELKKNLKTILELVIQLGVCHGLLQSYLAYACCTASDVNLSRTYDARRKI